METFFRIAYALEMRPSELMRAIEEAMEDYSSPKNS